MGNKDKRIDAYILKSPAFAQPVLTHLRKLVHIGCPPVEETIKWSMPFFDYRGMLCNMAAFKQHCSFGFWKSALMKNAIDMKNNNEQGMGHLGKIVSLKDLPPDKKIISWIKEAMKLNDDDIKLPERKRDVKKEVDIPVAFQKALAKNKIAAANFNNFSASNKTEYTAWIEEAKTTETQQKRIAIALEWLAEGKPRNWKYKKK